MKNVVYLYSRVMPYTIAGIDALLTNNDIKVHLVHYSVSSKAPYQLPKRKSIIYYDESTYSSLELLTLINELKPCFVFVTGWSNHKYLNCAAQLRKNNTPIITGCDTQWRGDLRQKIAIIFSFFFIRKYFTHIMVPGIYQYEYARLLGFKRKNILSPLYSANLSLFNDAFLKFKTTKKNKYPKNILFVGRLEEVKGISLLIKVFQEVNTDNRWSLTIVGNGSLKDSLEKKAEGANITFKPFLQPAQLVMEIEKAGVFCLPSYYEPWGVVIQEFAAAGLPLLTSNSCGANTVFVKEGYNGFTFKCDNSKSLSSKLQTIMSKTDEELHTYSVRSNLLSKSITQQMYASNFSQFLS